MSDFVILIKPGFLHLRKRILSILNVTVLSEKMIVLSEELIHKFYQEHLDKGFFLELKSYLLGNVVYALKVNGSIPETRLKIGHTDPNLASKNTIRHMFGKDKTKNAIHCSDSEESALSELEVLDL